MGLISLPVLRSQLPAPGQPGYQPVEVVTPQLQDFAVGHLAGKPVRGSNQEELATISEFLIDPRSGRVPFAVVNAGSKTFRLVPMSALQQGSGTGGIQLNLTRAQWDQIPTMSEQELLGSVSIDATRQQQFQQRFQLPAAEPAADNLIRATLMNEREVRIGNDTVGKVDDVIIDFHNRIAAPSVKMNPSFGPTDHNVLIHFPALQVNPEPRGAITANVSVNDLRSPGSSQLAPTGYPSGFNPQSQPQQITAAASAVQQALERDTSVPRGAVQAMPETHIVLRGTVDSQQKRMDLERAAQQAAPGVQIVNQLMVRNP
jgi:sporulation protein YlmC with PRC-barrel domain